ncbi:unnamed protein product [Amoebophrya sp. A25]|nr:unnamed protein product [Amoebophrya sp. A25]|eukprot:GSA25T00020358001.1
MNDMKKDKMWTLAVILFTWCGRGLPLFGVVHAAFQFPPRSKDGEGTRGRENAMFDDERSRSPSPIVVAGSAHVLDAVNCADGSSTAGDKEFLTWNGEDAGEGDGWCMSVEVQGGGVAGSTSSGGHEISGGIDAVQAKGRSKGEERGGSASSGGGDQETATSAHGIAINIVDLGSAQKESKTSDSTPTIQDHQGIDSGNFFSKKLPLLNLSAAIGGGHEARGSLPDSDGQSSLQNSRIDIHGHPTQQHAHCELAQRPQQHLLQHSSSSPRSPALSFRTITSTAPPNCRSRQHPLKIPSKYIRRLLIKGPEKADFSLVFLPWLGGGEFSPQEMNTFYQQLVHAVEEQVRIAVTESSSRGGGTASRPTPGGDHLQAGRGVGGGVKRGAALASPRLEQTWRKKVPTIRLVVPVATGVSSKTSSSFYSRLTRMFDWSDISACCVGRDREEGSGDVRTHPQDGSWETCGTRSAGDYTDCMDIDSDSPTEDGDGSEPRAWTDCATTSTGRGESVNVEVEDDPSEKPSWYRYIDYDTRFCDEREIEFCDVEGSSAAVWSIIDHEAEKHIKSRASTGTALQRSSARVNTGASASSSHDRSDLSPGSVEAQPQKMARSRASSSGEDGTIPSAAPSAATTPLLQAQPAPVDIHPSSIRALDDDDDVEMLVDSTEDPALHQIQTNAPVVRPTSPPITPGSSFLQQSSPGLEISSASLQSDQGRNPDQLPYSRIFLAGISQGGVLAQHVAFAKQVHLLNTCPEVTKASRGQGGGVDTAQLAHDHDEHHSSFLRLGGEGASSSHGNPLFYHDEHNMIHAPGPDPPSLETLPRFGGLLSYHSMMHRNTLDHYASLVARNEAPSGTLPGANTDVRLTPACVVVSETDQTFPASHVILRTQGAYDGLGMKRWEVVQQKRKGHAEGGVEFINKKVAQWIAARVVASSSGNRGGSSRQ